MAFLKTLEIGEFMWKLFFWSVAIVKKKLFKLQYSSSISGVNIPIFVSHQFPCGIKIITLASNPDIVPIAYSLFLHPHFLKWHTPKKGTNGRHHDWGYAIRVEQKGLLEWHYIWVVIAGRMKLVLQNKSL